MLIDAGADTQQALCTETTVLGLKVEFWGARGLGISVFPELALPSELCTCAHKGHEAGDCAQCT